MYSIQKSIQILVDRLQFRAKKGTINPAELSTQKQVIKTITQYVQTTEEEKLQWTTELNKLQQKINALTAFLQLTGWQKQAIYQVQNMPVDFIQRYHQKGDYIQSGWQFELFLAEYRGLTNQVNADFTILKTYQNCAQAKNPLTHHLAQLYPHLDSFFAQIEKSPSTPVKHDLKLPIYYLYV